MNGIFLLAILFMIATIGALGWGLYSMAIGGEYDDQHAEQLMTARVVFQGLAVAMLVLAYAAFY